MPVRRLRAYPSGIYWGVVMSLRDDTGLWGSDGAHDAPVDPLDWYRGQRDAALVKAADTEGYISTMEIATIRVAIAGHPDDISSAIAEESDRLTRVCLDDGLTSWCSPSTLKVWIARANDLI